MRWLWLSAAVVALDQLSKWLASALLVFHEPLPLVPFVNLNLCIGMVLATELINTVTELAVDLLTQRYHPMAKLAKDAGAGAVLITALASVAVGVAIFGPRLWRLLFGG